MTELEITKLAAEAMGLDVRVGPLQGTVMRCWIKIGNVEHEYWPLYNDVQAMALLKKFQLGIFPYGDGKWDAVFYRDDGSREQSSLFVDNLNLAICETVARLQLAKAKP